MTTKDLPKYNEGTYRELSKKLSDFDETESALKEAWEILKWVKKKWNQELFEKFQIEYDKVYNSIKIAIEDDKQISIQERKKIMIELWYMVELAEKESIIESKWFLSSLGDVWKNTDTNKAKEESKNILNKNISIYSKEDALWALDYLNSNYSKYPDFTPKNEKELNQKTKEALKQNMNNPIITANINWWYYNSEFWSPLNLWIYNYSQNINQDEQKSVVFKKENTQEITAWWLISVLWEKFQEATSFNYHTIKDLDDKYEVKNFQEMAIKKVLWLGENEDLSKNWFSNDYIHWFNNEKWNFLISTQELSDMLYSWDDITKINSKALSNYIFHLGQNKWLDPVELVKNISTKQLMQLWTLWSQDDWSNDSNNRKIAKETILNAEWWKDFVELVSVFKDMNSIETKFKELMNSEKPDEEIKKLPECFKEFFKTSSKELTSIYLKSIDNAISKAKEEHKDKNIDIYVSTFKQNIESIIKKDPFSIEELAKTIKQFSIDTWAEIDTVKLANEALKTADSLSKEKSSDLLVRRKSIVEQIVITRKELNNSHNDGKQKFQDDINKLYKELKEVNAEIILQEWNSAQIEINKYVLKNLTPEQEIQIANWELKIEQIVKELLEKGNANLLALVENQAKVVSRLKEENPEFAKKQKITSSFYAQNKEVLKTYNEIVKEDNELSNEKSKNLQTTKIIESNISQNSTNNFSREYSFSISKSEKWNSFISPNKNKDKKFEITKNEETLINTKKEYRENFSNFLDTINELWLEDFWDYRDEIFKTIDNLVWWSAFKKDSDKLNDLDTTRFLSTIVKSYWLEPQNRTIQDLKLQIKKINFWNETQEDVIKNNKWESNLFANFKNKFIKEWVFEEIKFEKFLLNPNQNKKSGIEQQIS